MEKLINSEFYWEVVESIEAWDYYLENNDRKTADELMHKWSGMKPALKFITGKSYGLTRTDEYCGLVNEADYNDFLFKSERKWKI